MTYTQRRRTELNKALFIRLQDPMLETINDGAYIYLKELPPHAERVEMLSDVKNEINYTHMVWDCVVPVFIPVMRNAVKCYSVGFVNRSDESLRMAAEKMSSNGLYYIPGMKLEKGVDYEGV